MAIRALCAAAVLAATACLPAASALVCPPLTQPQNVYDPFTRERIATICVPMQH